jgi:hypothetical protein
VYKKILFYCFLPLLIGALIYVFYRPHGLLNFSFYKPGALNVPMILIYSLPDFFWGFSMAMALHLFSFHFGYSRKLTTLIIMTLTLGSEFLQLLFPQNFTFDVWDIMALVIAIILSNLLVKTQNAERTF